MGWLGMLRLVLLGVLVSGTGAAALAQVFSPPAALNSAAVQAGLDDGNPRVVTDGSGTWVTVWDSLREGVPPDDRDLFFSRSLDHGASWSPQAPLNTDAAAADGRNDSRPSHAVAGSAWIAVWRADGVLGAGDTADDDVVYARSLDGGVSWTAPAPLDDADAGGFDNAPEIATDGGTWVTVWSRGNDTILASRSADAGVTWDDPVVLSTGFVGGSEHKFPHLATDGATWVVVWSGEGGAGSAIGSDRDVLYVTSTNDGQSWSAPQPLNGYATSDNSGGTRRFDRDARVATDGAGGWIAVWTSSPGSQDDDGDVRAARSTAPAAGWLPAQVVHASNGTTDNQHPQAIADGAGAWLVVWQSTDPLGGSIGTDLDILRSRSADGGVSWPAPVAVNTTASSGAPADDAPSIARDGGGRRVAVWRSDDTLGGTLAAGPNVLVAATGATGSCGDGVLQAGEQCDLGGTGNGSATSCCSATCTFRASGLPCRPAAGSCDQAEACSGTSGSCGTDVYLQAGTTCRPANGVCDDAEVCSGVGAACPNDAFETSATVCRPPAGVCDRAEQCSGSSATCPPDQKRADGCRASTGACDLAEVCDGLSNDCPADAFRPAGFPCRGLAGPCDVAETCSGNGGACPADQLRPATHECRAAAGACDLPERCNGVSAPCPQDAKRVDTCRPAAGICDVAESCDGEGDDCPPDGFQPGVVLCRAATGACDLAEHCTGGARDCPPDGRRPAGSVCRLDAGPCDLAETCDGTSAACPPDAFESPSIVCRAAAGACDLTETCTGAGPFCPQDARSTEQCRPAAGPCDNPESCDGVGVTCPADGRRRGSCRPATGLCDVAEECDGSSTQCPADGFIGAGTTCRAAAGPCDVPEACSGAAPGCPADRLEPAEVVCRPPAGACDLAERCTGTAAGCPGDRRSTDVCRPAADVCDVAERCDGVAAECPLDTVLPQGTTCRDATGLCDVAERCTGSSATCPGDAGLADGTTCDACESAACRAGVCAVPGQCDRVLRPPLTEEAVVGAKAAVLVPIGVEPADSSDRATFDAAGFLEGEIAGEGARAVEARARGAGALGSGIQVTKRVRGTLSSRRGFRRVLALRLNRRGKALLGTTGALRVQLVVRLRGPGEPVLLRFTREWRR